MQPNQPSLLATPKTAELSVKTAAAKEKDTSPPTAAAKTAKEGQAADGTAVAKVDDKAEAEADPAAEAAAERIKRALDIRGRIKDAKVPVVGMEVS